MGHAIHISSYKPEVLDDAKGESLIFMECFADIFGGMLMNLSVMHIDYPKWKSENPLGDDYKYSDSVSETGREVYTTIFEMDKLNRAMKTHPSNEERLQAIQHGVDAANVATFFQVLESTVENPPGVDPELRDYTIKVNRGMARGIGYHTGSTVSWEDPFTWAHKEAILITHENNLLAKNVIVYDQYIKWSESSEKLVVDFSFQLLNLNNVQVNLRGRVVSEMVPRDNPGDIVKVVPIDGMTYDVIIPPGGDTEIKGQLGWLTKEGFMPGLLLPPDQRSFYWVFSSTDQMVDSGLTKTRMTDFRRWDEKALKNLIDIVSEIMDYRDDLFQFAKGMGLSFAQTTERTRVGASIYGSKLEEGSDRQHEIFADETDKVATYSLTIYQGKNVVIAKSRFDDILKSFKKEFSDLENTDPSEDKISKMVDFVDNDDHILRLLLFDFNGEWKVSVEIYGPLKR